MTAITPNTPARRRRGFTLVELLVAMALIIFIMVILTEAFTAGVGTFRVLKAQGDMQEKLRAAGSLLRDDLRQPHFDSAQKLSNLTGAGPTLINGGYFYIRQDPSDPSEGVDGFGIRSLIMGPQGVQPRRGPALCFTVRRLNNTPDDYFVGRLSGAAPAAEGALLTSQGPLDYQQPNALISQWAEVGWFLVPTAGSTTADGVTQLYSLRRRVRVITPDSPTVATGTLNAANIPAALWGPRYAEVSCLPIPLAPNGTLHFNTPSDLTNPAYQAMPLSLVPLAGANSIGQADGDPSWFGDDIVITDVVSFNVRVLRPGGALPVDVGGVYNTGLTPTQRINALEISIRVWDVKTQLSRQLTVVQDM